MIYKRTRRIQQDKYLNVFYRLGMGQHERCPRDPQEGEEFVSDPGSLPEILALRVPHGGGGGWRDGSEVKSTSCSFRGPEVNSQQLRGI